MILCTGDSKNEIYEAGRDVKAIRGKYLILYKSVV